MNNLTLGIIISGIFIYIVLIYTYVIPWIDKIPQAGAKMVNCDKCGKSVEDWDLLEHKDEENDFVYFRCQKCRKIGWMGI